MCNPFKSVTKVFKKVAKAATKVAPAALAIGAIVFTAGAALGVSGMAGGWGSEVSGLIAKTGASSTLASVLGGAITQAGYGAAVGGAIGGMTGKGLLRGAQAGALTGAVTGGLMGAAGAPTDPLRGIGARPTESASASPIRINPAAGPGLTESVSRLGDIPPVGLDRTAVEAGTMEGLWRTSAAATTAGDGGGTGMMAFLNRNPATAQLIGGAVSGVGQGAGAYFGAQEEAAGRREAAQLEIQAQREKRAAVAGSYTGLSGGLLRPSAGTTGTGFPSPGTRYDPQIYSGHYRYDPERGEVVFVRDTAAA